MKSNLYIPKTITVGFQNRTDTYTQKLGYVIYTDHTGKLRKEASWQGWRDRKIEPITIDNTPQNGFTLNKGVQRDRYWGSGRSVIRVWDPRDFEFEISIDNLIGVLMHADVSKRDITEPCVFAWHGTELILLPTNSLEYQESLKYTEKQETKFSAKELVAGRSYTPKKTPDPVVYLGRFDRYTVDYETEEGDNYYSRNTQRALVNAKKKAKCHVFMDPKTMNAEVKDPAAYLATVASDETHPNFAALLDRYYEDCESQPMIGVKVAATLDSYPSSAWFSIPGNEHEFVQVRLATETYEIRDHSVVATVIRTARFVPETKRVELSHGGHPGGWSSPRITPHSLPNSEHMIAHGQQLASAIAPRLRAVLSKDMSGVNWQEQSKYKREALYDILQHFGGGYLRPILADGKVARNYYIY